jgi:homoserine dehydrogenase
VVEGSEDGVDAAHKLSILASLSFGSVIDFGGVEARGVRKILAADIAQAKTLGYRIRLIGLAEIDGDNGSSTIFQRVEPCLVPLSHPLAHVTGATNAVVAEGNFSGRLLFQGAGAGDKPTASAVVADLVDIARKETGPAFSMPSAELEKYSGIPAMSLHIKRGRSLFVNSRLSNWMTFTWFE